MSVKTETVTIPAVPERIEQNSYSVCDCCGFTQPIRVWDGGVSMWYDHQMQTCDGCSKDVCSKCRTVRYVPTDDEDSGQIVYCDECNKKNPSPPTKDEQLTTLRQQVAALARECEAARGRLTNLGVAYTTVGPEFPSHPKCKAYAEARAATDALIPDLTTVAGGSNG